MSLAPTFWRLLAGTILLASLAACALPRSGPYYSEITDAPAPDAYGFEVVPVSADVVRINRVDERSGFSVSFIEARSEAPYTLARGDILAITVWENIDEGLLNPAGIGATPLPNSQVDEKGRVFVPYIGLVPASGRNINDLREAIRTQLAEKTLNPQVDILRVESKGRLISVQGVVNAPGLYPIEPATTHLLPMMARAGGVNIDPEVVQLKLRRGRIQGAIWLQDLYDDPNTDVHLRTGDAIIAQRDRRTFTALGAVSGPTSVQFPMRDLNVVTALGTVGGLRELTADPTGVFLFREEPVEISQRLFPDREITEPQRVAYILDLTRPEGMFLGSDFIMRDGDTIFVTTAPFVRWLKILSAVTPLVNTAGATRSLGGF